ncbi:peptide ABC transporter substrate-binding protein [bacterium]|nr:MAG: peptide ABC transporter substrate-binding protein [bacterium]
MRPLRLLPLLLLLAGCSKGNFNSRSTTGAAVLTYPLENKVTTLDPGRVQDAIMPEIMANVFEGLVAYDEKNTISPMLAERWDVTEGGKTYVFHLREAKFQDGTPVTAESFKWTWERNLGPELASPIATGYLGDIVGVKEFADGKAKSVSGVKVVDEHTLSVTLDKPRPYFLGNLTYPCAFVLPKSVGTKEIRTVDKAIGTGPFKLTKVIEDQQIDLVANAGYWGGKPKVEKIARPVVIDNATRLSGFRNGQYDFLLLPRSDVANVQSDPKLKPLLRFQQRPAVFYFLINQKEYAPFKDVRVRKAFAMAINRESIVNDLLTGQTVANGLVPPGVPGFQEGYKGLPYDPEGARKLLSEAGYPSGKGLPDLELNYRSGRPDSRVASEAVATALKKELNVPISTKALELGALVSRRNKDELQMAFMSWNADYLDPQNFLSLLMTSDSKLNHDGFNSPEFDRLCAQADVDLNPERRMGLYQQAERIAVEQAARLPLYFEMQPILVSPNVKGLRESLFGILPHTKTEIVR